MNKIVVKHTCIEINNYEFGDSPRLENFFSIWDPLYHTVKYQCIEYIEEEKKLILPRGIDIYWLENLFQCNAILDKKHDKINEIEPIMIKYLPRDSTQKEALRFVLGQKEYRHTSTKSQLSLNLNTGAGKTYIAVASIAWMNMRSMVIASSIDWLNQWKKCICEYTNIKPQEIFIISGTNSIYRLLNTDNSKYKIFLASHNTIKSYGDKVGWKSVGDLFKYLGIGLKIYDEAHLNLTNLSMIDFYTNTYKTLYLTATPARSNREENDIYKLYFKNIPSIDLFDEENDPRTEYHSIHFNSHPTPQNLSKAKNAYGFDRNYYIGYIVDTENFKRLLHIIMNDIVKNTNGKILIYIGTNDSIKKVYDWIVAHYPTYIDNIGIYTSLTTGNKKQELEKKIILSTTKSCGAAVDIKGLKTTIVLAEPFKSEVLARQSLGRTRDRDTLYIDVVDEGFFYCKNYYNKKKPIFEKYATECIGNRISDSELINRSDDIINTRSNLIVPIIKRKDNNKAIINQIVIDKEL